MNNSNYLKSLQKLAVLLLLVFPLVLSAQESRVIKGKVLDSVKGLPLPGASIFVDQTIGAETTMKGVISNYNMGTVSDVNGNFSITVPKGVTTITCSFISFDTQKISVEGKDVVVVRLVESNTALDEVVVTGYQNIKQRKFTSSVTKLESKDIKQAGVASVDQMLTGQIAGVQASVSSGAPGSPTRIRIRGTSSLSGNQDPLWVLDGMPLEGTSLPDMKDKNIDQLVNSSIAGLNPNDIADITILKDAAATAIYGARAANGVIVITTKKGKKGNMVVNFNSTLSLVMRPDFDKLHLLSSNEKVDMELALARRSDLTYRNNRGGVSRILNKYGAYDAYQKGGYDLLSAEAKAEIEKLRLTNTNWCNELYQQAVNQDHSLSISGGSDKANYYFSAGYYNEKGTTIGTGMSRLNLTMKSDFQLHPNLNIGVSLFTNQKRQDSYLTGTELFTNPARYSRSANPYLGIDDENGYIYDQEIEGISDRYVKFNYIEERENTSNILKTQSLNAIFDLKWNVWKNVKYTSQFGVQYDNANTEQFADKESYFTRIERERSRTYNKDTKKFYYFIPEGGVIKNFEKRENQWNWKNMLEYNKTFDEKHELDLMMGNELRKTYSRSINTAGYGFDQQTLTTRPIIFPSASNALSYKLFNKQLTENAYASFFATASYTYDRKYTIFGSVRYDGSDLFGVDPKYKYLPLWSAGFAWNVLGEEWMDRASQISTFKIRGSYGLQGNIDKHTSPFILGSLNNETILPDNMENVVSIEGLPNTRLRWEKTTTWNGGVDFGVLKNRIVLGLDLYNRVSSDLIGERALSLENGMDFTSENWAQVTNRGFEINLTTRNIQTANFSWTSNFNISKNINNVDKINIKEGDVVPSRVGHPIGSLFAIKTAGLDDQGYPLFWKDGNKVSVWDFFQLKQTIMPGIPELGIPDTHEPRLVDTKHTHKQLRELYTYMGSTDPRLSGGFINNFKYKGVSLNISMSFNIKQWVKQTPFYSMTQLDRGYNSTSKINEVWSATNKNGKYPAIVGPTSYNESRIDEYYWMSGEGKAINAFNDLDIWYKELSYIRVNSIRLGYDLPIYILKKLGVSSAKFNIEGRNLFVFGTNTDGFFDPESYGSIYAQPIPKVVSVGLNVTF
jgi:TonB-linked SusC/RagA family outer membrane protein